MRAACVYAQAGVFAAAKRPVELRKILQYVGLESAIPHEPRRLCAFSHKAGPEVSRKREAVCGYEGIQKSRAFNRSEPRVAINAAKNVCGFIHSRLFDEEL